MKTWGLANYRPFSENSIMANNDSCCTIAVQRAMMEREKQLMRVMVEQGLTLRQIAAIFRTLLIHRRLTKGANL